MNAAAIAPTSARQGFPQMSESPAMTDPAPSPKPPSPRRRWRRWAVRGPLLVLAGLFLYEAGRIVAGANRHTVIPGKVYRSAQPSAEQVRDAVRANGIRTVVNLRGLCDNFDWYKAQATATGELGVSQEDICLSANTLPPPSELRRLLEVLDRTEYPILIHCRRGADRTGLVAVMALLLFTDATLDEARRQLLPRYGHFRFGRTAAIDEFFDIYERWLSGRPHAPPVFRDWLTNHYCPGPARSRLTWVSQPSATWPADKPLALKVSAENVSDTAWQLKPGVFAAIHLAYTLYDATGETVQGERTGFRFETVPPGGKTEFALGIRKLKPGRYTIAAELHDATAAGVAFRTNSFVKLGDGSLVTELEVK